jgi:hypothetical protein
MGLERYVQVYSLKIATGIHGDIPDFTLPGQALHDGLPNQIHLFNLSLEGPRVPMIREDIIKYAPSALVVIAAGNDKLNMNAPENLRVNGSFRKDNGAPLDNVIFVAALMDVGDLTPDSNRGDVAVEIAAPGNNIWSTVQGGGFGAITGTSQAAPLVTSTAAILLAERESFPAEIKERILATCDWDDKLSKSHLVAEGCRLNMAKAVITTSDLVELYTSSAQGTPTWLRGTVDSTLLQVEDLKGKPVDSSVIQRIWFKDRRGNVRVALRGAGHISAKLKSSKITLVLRNGDICPLTHVPCEIDAQDVHDIVFKW